MKKIQHIATVSEYNGIATHKTYHPLVSVVDLSQVAPREGSTEKADIQAISFGFYAVFLKKSKNCDIRYGRNFYDYQEGTLVFIAPGQVVSIEEDGTDYQPNGIALLFHPDMIRGTSLAHNMKEHIFFSYDVFEALHLSGEEEQVIMECFQKIGHELKRPVDKHSKKLIVSNIELLLNYCERYYDRQFITRGHASTSTLAKFETLLDDYFFSDEPKKLGIPSVAFFADKLHFSANYFGDLIKKETGKTALEHIQAKLLDVAKNKIFDPGKTVSEVAYEVGFKYPQHFSRFFKQHVGYTPNEYRMLN